MNWEHISKQVGLSEAFIEEHAANIDWDSIALSQPLSLEFIQKHKAYLSVFLLKQNPHIVSFQEEIYKIFDYKEMIFVDTESSYINLDDILDKQISISTGLSPSSFGSLAEPNVDIELDDFLEIAASMTEKTTSHEVACSNSHNPFSELALRLDDDDNDIVTDAPKKTYTSNEMNTSPSSFDPFNQFHLDIMDEDF